MKADTTGKFLKLNAHKWGDKIALRQKRRGIWQKYTWKQTYDLAKLVCMGLFSLGLKRGDKVTLLGDPEIELYLAYYAIQAGGGWILGIYPDCTPEEIKYFINHSDTKFVFARDQEQVDKLLMIKADLPLVERVIWWEPKGMRKYTDAWLLSFDDVKDLGQKHEQNHHGAFEDSIEQSNGEEVFGLFYTSGTTGDPKGTMITYDAMNTSIEYIHGKMGLRPGHNILSFVPPAWFAEPSWSSGPSLRWGASINCPEKPDTYLEDFREISPSIGAFGSRQYEDIASTMQIKIKDASFLKRFAFNLFLPIGYKMADLEFEKKRPNLLLKFLNFLAKKLVFRPLLDKHGFAKGMYFAVGGTVLGGDTFRFLRAIGIPLIQIYGSTEAGLVGKHSSENIRKETVGRIFPGVEARIDENGELLIRSDATCLGYYKNQEATDEKFESSGWFHTGDAMEIDEWGDLIFLDRVEEMEELSTGIKYAPSYIEGQLRFCAYIKDVMTIGGKNREYVSALINIDFDAVGKWAESQHISYTTMVDLSQKPEVADLVLSDIQRVNSTISKGSNLQKFVILHKEFDPDEAELTRTRKLRRTLVQDRFSDLIQAIYEGRKEHSIVTPVTYRDGRKGQTTADLKIRELKEQ